jgi:hypothetical protein
VRRFLSMDRNPVAVREGRRRLFFFCFFGGLSGHTCSSTVILRARNAVQATVRRFGERDLRPRTCIDDGTPGLRGVER